MVVLPSVHLLFCPLCRSDFLLRNRVTVFSILRLCSISNLYYGTDTKDPTYTINFVYSTVECNLAIISASIPTLYSMSKRLYPRLFSICEDTIPPSIRLGEGERTESYALKTIGGSTMHYMRGLDPRSSRTSQSRTNSVTTSEEDILARSVITKTVKVDIVVEDKLPTDNGNRDDDSISEAASRFHFDGSVRRFVHPSESSHNNWRLASNPFGNGL